jgi:hypothetical protein
LFGPDNPPELKRLTDDASSSALQRQLDGAVRSSPANRMRQESMGFSE